MTVAVLDRRELRDAVCDVHIATLPGRPPEWLEQCIASVDAEPVNWYLIDAIPGRLGEVRATGYQLGKTPYRSPVDDDDYVLPGAFERGVEVLEQRPDVVSTYCDWRMIASDGKILESHRPRRAYNPFRHIFDRHHVAQLHVYRAAQLIPYLDDLPLWHNHDEHWLSAMLSAHGWHERIPEVLYCVRQHGGARASADRSPAETRACTSAVSPVLMRAHRATMTSL